MLRAGDDVVVLPSGDHSRIARIDTTDGPIDEAFAPMSVSIALEDDLDVSRGDMICRAHNQPSVGREVDAIVCWMSERPVCRRAALRDQAHHAHARAVVAEVLHRIDVDTLHRDEGAMELGLNDIGRLELRTSVPLVFDAYRRNRATGELHPHRRGDERHGGRGNGHGRRTAGRHRADGPHGVGARALGSGPARP